MPPVVTGAVVAVIGLNLAPIAVKSIAASAFDTWMRHRDDRGVGLVAVRAPRMVRRLPILVGAIVGYVALCGARQRHGPRQADRLRGVASARVDRPAALHGAACGTRRPWR